MLSLLSWTHLCHIDLEFLRIESKKTWISSFIHLISNTQKKKKKEYKPRKRRKNPKKEGSTNPRKEKKKSTAKKKTHGTHKSSLHQAHPDRRSMVQFTISITEQTIWTNYTQLLKMWMIWKKKLWKRDEQDWVFLLIFQPKLPQLV